MRNKKFFFLGLCYLICGLWLRHSQAADNPVTIMIDDHGQQAVPAAQTTANPDCYLQQLAGQDGFPRYAGKGFSLTWPEADMPGMGLYRLHGDNIGCTGENLEVIPVNLQEHTDPDTGIHWTRFPLSNLLEGVYCLTNVGMPNVTERAYCFHWDLQ